MAIEQRTLEQLQHLQDLYRRGYQSDVVDRAIKKIIAIERAAAERELVSLQKRLEVFEGRYGMSSAEF
jgi:plasmid maintenance system killer protein